MNHGLWVLEDDVEWSGNWNDLFDKYTKADFVASSMQQKTFYKYFRKMSSKKFQERFVFKPDNHTRPHVILAEEHLVKYSARFEKEMRQLLDDGYHAHSEYGTCSIATKLGFRCLSQ